MLSRNTPARLDPDSEPAAPATSAAKAVSPRTAAKLKGKPAAGTGPKARFSLFSGSGKTASLTAPAGKPGTNLPGRRNVTPANLRLGLMVGTALLLGALSIYVNTSGTATNSVVTAEAPTGLSPVQNVQAPLVAGTPGLTTPGRSTSPPDPVTVTGTAFRTDAQGAGASGTGTQNAGVAQAAPGKAGSPPTPDALPAAETTIPDVFSAAQTDAASQRSAATPAPQGGSVSRAPMTLPGMPMSAVMQSVPVAAAVPLSIRAAPPAPVQMVPATLPVTLPPMQQLRPLPAPISALPGAVSTLTLTRPGLTSASQPAQTSARGVSLVGIADGETPTAILDTPAGQLMAAVGETVDVQGVPYTLKAIKTSSVILTHAQDRLTLTETP